MPDARDFLRTNLTGVKEDLVFTNQDGGDAIFIMRGAGQPTSSADTKAVINYGYAVGNFISRQTHLSGSQSSSLYSSSHPVFQVPLQNTGSQQVNSSTLEVFLNGLSIDPTNDYILSGSNNVVIYAPTGSYGYVLKSSDKIKIKYQQGF